MQRGLPLGSQYMQLLQRGVTPPQLQHGFCYCREEGPAYCYCGGNKCYCYEGWDPESSFLALEQSGSHIYMLLDC